MEKALEILLQQSAIVVLMAVVIYFLWRKLEKKDTEISELQKFILQEQKDNSEQLREDQREMIEAMNNVSKSMTEIFNHLKYGNSRNKG